MSSRSGRRLLASVAVAAALVGGIGAGAGTAVAQSGDSSASAPGAESGLSSSDLEVLVIGSATLPIEAVVSWVRWITTGDTWEPSTAYLEFCRLFNPNCFTLGGQG